MSHAKNRTHKFFLFPITTIYNFLLDEKSKKLRYRVKYLWILTLCVGVTWECVCIHCINGKRGQLWIGDPALFLKYLIKIGWIAKPCDLQHLFKGQRGLLQVKASVFNLARLYQLGESVCLYGKRPLFLCRFFPVIAGGDVVFLSKQSAEVGVVGKANGINNAF